MTTRRPASTSSCWECERGEHPETGGVHQPWHCKPDRCPERSKHAEQVYGGRFEKRLTSVNRDGVITTAYIDGRKASENYKQSRCICGLLLIWTPRTAADSRPDAGSALVSLLLAVCIVGGLIGLLLVGQAAMCAMHTTPGDRPIYCESAEAQR
jgi:hypothetical protein